MKFIVGFLLVAIGLPCFVAAFVFVANKFLSSESKARATDAMNEEYRDGDGW